MASPFDPLMISSTPRQRTLGRNATGGPRGALRHSLCGAGREVRDAPSAGDERRKRCGRALAAYIHPSNADSGAYGGMSFVIFPAEDAPCLVAMVIGTQGLAPDETILGRPGHARKMQAVCSWLNHEFGHGEQVAWAKKTQRGWILTRLTRS